VAFGHLKQTFLHKYKQEKYKYEKNRIVLFALLLNIDVKANGGLVDGSAVYRTGDIVLIKQANIKLEKETLKIKLYGDYSIVNVKYLLKNNSYSKIDVTYGFP